MTGAVSANPFDKYGPRHVYDSDDSCCSCNIVSGVKNAVSGVISGIGSVFSFAKEKVSDISKSGVGKVISSVVNPIKNTAILLGSYATVSSVTQTIAQSIQNVALSSINKIVTVKGAYSSIREAFTKTLSIDSVKNNFTSSLDILPLLFCFAIPIGLYYLQTKKIINPVATPKVALANGINTAASIAIGTATLGTVRNAGLGILGAYFWPAATIIGTLLAIKPFFQIAKEIYNSIE